MTAEQVAELVGVGRVWWYRPSDQTFHANTSFAPPAEGDVYLLDASDEWLSQFGGDWQKLADLLSPLTGRLDTLGDE